MDTHVQTHFIVVEKFMRKLSITLANIVRAVALFVIMTVCIVFTFNFLCTLIVLGIVSHYFSSISTFESVKLLAENDHLLTSMIIVDIDALVTLVQV